MQLRWYQRDQAGVADALRSGQRADMAATTACGPLDELVALHDELGVFAALERVPVARRRRGVNDSLLLRTLAVLPFLETHSLSGAAGQLFGDPAILLHLGWSPVQIQMGDNERHGNAAGRQLGSLPCHPQTLCDELRRVGENAWLRVQRKGVKQLFEQQFLHGGVYAIDGTGLGDGLRLVCLVCVSQERPLMVAWRLLEGTASEKGKEASVTRSLIEQALELGGKGCIELLLVDALYADGPFLAWCHYEHDIEVLVPLPSDRELHHDLLQQAEAGTLPLQRYSYVRQIQGHKQRRTLDLGAQGGLTTWDSFVAAAHRYGDEHPSLWGCLVMPVDPVSDEDRPWTLCSTRPWVSGVAAYESFRDRWHIENDTNRELKEAWDLEQQRWGRDLATQRGRVTLTCLAFNTAQLYLTKAGRRLSGHGIRRLRNAAHSELGHSPVVIYWGRNYAIFPLEQFLELTGQPVRCTLRPRLACIRGP